MTDDQQIAEAMLTVVDGAGKPFLGSLLVRVHNSQGQAAAPSEHSGPSIMIRVPFHNGIGDDYAVSVAAGGYKDAGCFFKANPKVLAEPQLLLLRSAPKPEFSDWESFKNEHPKTAALLGRGIPEADAKAHYEGLITTAPNALACLLNLGQAMQEMDLGEGKTPLDFIKAIRWDFHLAQDRFFAYADPAMIPLVREAAGKGFFAEEKDCKMFHPGASCSWKQVAFPVANVQLTFHEQDRAVINGIDCITIEPDIDLYRELVEHGFAEVFPNLLSGGLTDPFAVYAMRWTTAQDDDGPSFNPGYELA
ncbi:MAG: hypothetical protein ACRYFU_24370 [Janthinobacterium lividum]